jgi:acyl carrier protein
MNESETSRIRAGLRDAFRQIAPEVDLEGIDPGGDLREEVDLDSVDAMNLIVLIDEILGVEIPEGDYDRITTLEGLIRYLQDRLPPES